VPQADAAKPSARNPWAWIPTLYFAEGIPYAIVTAVSIALYKDLHISNEKIAFFTSWITLPWVLKPFWGPVIDQVKTRRLWIWSMQLVIGAGFASIALLLPGENVLRWSLAVFLLVAFSSATHDIAADGFYLLANSEAEQSFFSGVRNTFYRLATICGQGMLLVLAGRMQKQTGNLVLAWQVAFGLAAATILLLAVYHGLLLPKPPTDRPGDSRSAAIFLREFFGTFGAFFAKPRIGTMILFLLFYRFGEAQLMKMVLPFLRDPRDRGGLGLATDEVGFLYGTVGVAALLAGGVLGGILASRNGLRAWLWPMVIVMHVPDAVFIYLSRVQPESHWLIGTCLATEQFGYGFGFTAYMLYMLYIARGAHATAHYAICTGFMALGVMLPGMWSGWLQQRLGYPLFFLWVLAATIPGFIMTAIAPLDPAFGTRRN
jgi:PAT family beta-lactamase induction signal transducer AmpG